jgi:hypothetical protein
MYKSRKEKFYDEKYVTYVSDYVIIYDKKSSENLIPMIWK